MLCAKGTINDIRSTLMRWRFSPTDLLHYQQCLIYHLNWDAQHPARYLEVISYSDTHNASFATIGIDRIGLLIEAIGAEAANLLEVDELCVAI